MRRFNGPMLESMMTTLRVPDDQPIESKMVSRAIRSAQTQVEQQNFEVRKDVLKYDEVLNRQRTVIYDERRKVLEGADLHVQIQSMVDDVIGAYVDGATETGYSEDWDLELLWTGLKALYPVGLDRTELLDRVADGDQAALSAETLKEELLADVHRAYDEREAALGSEVMRELERRVLLSVLDRKWREHLYEMDYLRAGIHLRAMANRDPVVEYQREGFDMFNAMLDGIKEESVGFLFNLEVKTKEEQEAEAAAKQAEAEAAALAAAQEGTARVLARQAAEAAAAQAPPAAQPTAPARRPPARARAKAPVAAAAPAVEAPKPSGTGPQLAVKGLDAPRPAGEPPVLRARRWTARRRRAARRRRRRPPRSPAPRRPPRNAPVPLRVGQEVQAVPRGRRPLKARAAPCSRGPADYQERGTGVCSADLQGGAPPPAVDALQPGGHRVRPPVAPGDRADLGDAVDRLGDVHRARPAAARCPRRTTGAAVRPTARRRPRADVSGWTWTSGRRPASASSVRVISRRPASRGSGSSARPDQVGPKSSCSPEACPGAGPRAGSVDRPRDGDTGPDQPDRDPLVLAAAAAASGRRPVGAVPVRVRRRQRGGARRSSGSPGSWGGRCVARVRGRTAVRAVAAPGRGGSTSGSGPMTSALARHQACDRGGDLAVAR